MARSIHNPTTALFPVPVVMVSCGNFENRRNIITLAWVGTVCSEPPMVAIAVRPSRYSFDLILENGEFVVNLPTIHEAAAVDICGTTSGRDHDKFITTGLTPLPASRVAPPLIEQCPVNLECALRHSIKAGTHEIFIGEVLVVQVDEERTTGKGLIRPEEALCYHGNEYRALGGLVEYRAFTAGHK